MWDYTPENDPDHEDTVFLIIVSVIALCVIYALAAVCL